MSRHSTLYTASTEILCLPQKRILVITRTKFVSKQSYEIDRSSRLRPRQTCEQEHVGLSNAFLHNSAASDLRCVVIGQYAMGLSFVDRSIELRYWGRAAVTSFRFRMLSSPECLHTYMHSKGYKDKRLKEMKFGQHVIYSLFFCRNKPPSSSPPQCLPSRRRPEDIVSVS